MKLILCIKSHGWVEVELTPPNYSEFSFEENCKMREQYVQFMIQKMKITYQKMMEKSGSEIILVCGSKMNEEVEYPALQIA